MKRRLIPAVAVLLLLGACAGNRAYHDQMRNAWPLVKVSGDTVEAVNPDPLSFDPKLGSVVINWRLPEKGYSFARNGIVIDGELDRPGGKLISREQKEVVDCKPLLESRQFQCVYRNSRPGTFKYTVNVLRDGKPLKPLDPQITNVR